MTATAHKPNAEVKALDMEEKPKSKRGGARKTPDGHKRVAGFLLKDAEYAVLEKIADEEDRDAVDVARVLVKKAIKAYIKAPQ